MEVPSESFHKRFWDSRTCYPRRAFNQRLTNGQPSWVVGLQGPYWVGLGVLDGRAPQSALACGPVALEGPFAGR